MIAPTSFFGILLRSALGGAFIALLLWLSQAHKPFVSGLFMFFPIISLPIFLFTAVQPDGMPRVRELIIGGFAALPIWFGFGGALFWASYRMRPIPAIGFALV